MSFFFLKKFISAWLLPLPLSLTLGLAGFIFFCFHRQKCGRLCLGLSLVILILFSFKPFPDFLINNLESHYQNLARPPSGIKQVVILGGSIGKISNQSAQIGNDSLARLIEGIRLYRQIPQGKLIFTGGSVYGEPSIAKSMQQIAVSLGVPVQDIQIAGDAKDTLQETLQLKLLLKAQPFILVTSAVHMTRAMQLCQRQHLSAIPAPAHYLNGSTEGVKLYFPSSYNLYLADLAIHEYLGLLWLQFSQ